MPRLLVAEGVTSRRPSERASGTGQCSGDAGRAGGPRRGDRAGPGQHRARRARACPAADEGTAPWRHRPRTSWESGRVRCCGSRSVVRGSRFAVRGSRVRGSGVGLGSSVEGDLAAVGEPVVVGGIVDAAVVVPAEQASVREVGGTAVGTRGGRGGCGTARGACHSLRRCSRPGSGRGRGVGARCGTGAADRGRGPGRRRRGRRGTIPAVHASRRACAADRSPPVSSPVSSPAAPTPPRSWSRVMVTTTVAETPPWVGRASAGIRSIRSQNASPRATGAG